jgi:hypothetical protein
MSEIRSLPDKLFDKAYLIQKQADVALDHGVIRFVLGNFNFTTNYTPRP